GPPSVRGHRGTGDVPPHGNGRAATEQTEPGRVARSGDDLLEVPGEGSAEALCELPGTGGRSAALPRWRTDGGPADRGAGARLALVPPQAGPGGLGRRGDAIGGFVRRRCL